MQEDTSQYSHLKLSHNGRMKWIIDLNLLYLVYTYCTYTLTCYLYFQTYFFIPRTVLSIIS